MANTTDLATISPGKAAQLHRIIGPEDVPIDYHGERIDFSHLDENNMYVLWRLWKTLERFSRKYESVLKPYLWWLAETKRDLLPPDMTAFMHWLRDEAITSKWEDGRRISEDTRGAWLSAVRQAYRRLLNNKEFRMWMRQRAELAYGDKWFEEYTYWLEYLMLAAEEEPIFKTTRRARVDRLWLTSDEAALLINAPGLSTLRGLQHTAAIMICLATGIRVHELILLDVADLDVKVKTERCLLVKVIEEEGRVTGPKTSEHLAKERTPPWGDYDMWLDTVIADYLAWAGIKEGRVFRQIRKGRERTGEPIKTTQWFGGLLFKYSKMINGRDGKGDHITPHMLRRTYARSQFDAIVEGAPEMAMQRAEAIRQNMGHADLKTTMNSYIGPLDIKLRRAKFVIGPDYRRAAKQASKMVRVPKVKIKGKVREQNIIMLTLEDAKDGWIYQRDLYSDLVTKSERVAFSKASAALWKDGKLDKWDWSPVKHRGRPLRILTRPGVPPDVTEWDEDSRTPIIPIKVLK